MSGRWLGVPGRESELSSPAGSSSRRASRHAQAPPRPREGREWGTFPGPPSSGPRPWPPTLLGLRSPRGRPRALQGLPLAARENTGGLVSGGRPRGAPGVSNQETEPKGPTQHLKQHCYRVPSRPSRRHGKSQEQGGLAYQAQVSRTPPPPAVPSYSGAHSWALAAQREGEKLLGDKGFEVAPPPV